MATITANIDATQSVIPVSVSTGDPGTFWTIGSEAIQLLGTSRGPLGRSFLRTYWSVERGIAGTTAASHSSGATLTQYYPDANSSGGGGSISATDGVTTVDPATSLSFVRSSIADGGSGVAEVTPYPPPWTVDEHGTLTIQPDDANVDCLVLKDSVGNIIAKFGQVPDFTSIPLMVDSGGDIGLTMKAGGSGFFVQTAASVVDFTGAGLAIGTDGSINIIGDPGSNGMTVQAPATSPPSQLLRIKDAGGALIFTVNADGSVHIKTGTSIVADL